jgi:hypothetical protein
MLYLFILSLILICGLFGFGKRLLHTMKFQRALLADER